MESKMNWSRGSFAKKVFFTANFNSFLSNVFVHLKHAALGYNQLLKKRIFSQLNWKIQPPGINGFQISTLKLVPFSTVKL